MIVKNPQDTSNVFNPDFLSVISVFKVISHIFKNGLSRTEAPLLKASFSTIVWIIQIVAFPAPKQLLLDTFTAYSTIYWSIITILSSLLPVFMCYSILREYMKCSLWNVNTFSDIEFVVNDFVSASSKVIIKRVHYFMYL